MPATISVTSSAWAATYWFIDESFKVEPLPGGIDIGEIGDDDVKGAVFLGVDVGKKIGSNKGDAAFEIVIIEIGRAHV